MRALGTTLGRVRATRQSCEQHALPPACPLQRGNPCHASAGTAAQRRLRRRGTCRLGAAASAAAHDAPAAQDGAGQGSRNILVAIDSSEDSRYALQWTVHELFRPGDVVHVCHCLPVMALPGGMYAVPDGRLAMVNVDALLANDEQFLLAEAQVVQRMCQQAFPPEGQVAHVVDILREEPLGGGDRGRVAQALCRKANELQAAALVIASHTKSGLSEFLLGSVAAHCITHSPRPVLVLHPPSHSAQGPGLVDRLASAAAAVLGGTQQQQQQRVAAGADAGGEAAGGGAEEQKAGAGAAPGVHSECSCSVRRNILLAVDDSEASERACAWALSNLYRPGDTFHLLRIIPTLPFRAAYGGPVLDGLVFYSDAPTDAFKSATEHYMQHRFEPKLKAAGVPYEVDIVVEAVDDSVAGVGAAICRKAEGLGAAAVVLGSHISGGLMQFMLGSVATHVAHNCRCPVAVLH